MRLFVALDIDEAIQQRLDDYVRTLQPRLPGVRFVRSNTYHVTLKFLGEVRNADAVRQCLREVRAAGFRDSVRRCRLLSQCTRAASLLGGIECARAARAGARRRSVAGSAGLCAGARDFHPHLTLARNGSGRPRPVRGERPPEAFAQLVCNCGIESGAGVRYNDGARILFIRKQAVAQRGAATTSSKPSPSREGAATLLWNMK